MTPRLWRPRVAAKYRDLQHLDYFEEGTWLEARSEEKHVEIPGEFHHMKSTLRGHSNYFLCMYNILKLHINKEDQRGVNPSICMFHSSVLLFCLLLTSPRTPTAVESYCFHQKILFTRVRKRRYSRQSHLHLFQFPWSPTNSCLPWRRIAVSLYNSLQEMLLQPTVAGPLGSRNFGPWK